MIRTAGEITVRMKQAKESVETVQIDPITKADDSRNKQVFFALIATVFTAPGLFSLNPLSWLVLGVSGWVLYQRISLNEYWELDPSRKEIRATSNKPGSKVYSTKLSFQDIAFVAVDARLHSRGGGNSSGPRVHTWEYGLAVFTKSGVLHQLYPDLSKDFKDVWDAAEATAELVGTELMKPVPMAELEVVSNLGKTVLSYKVNPTDSGLGAEAAVEPAVEEVVPNSTLEATPSSLMENRRRFELLHDCQVTTSRTIGTIGLVILGPFFLGGLSYFSRGEFFWGLVLTLTLAPLIFLSLRLLITPIVKEVTSFEPEGAVVVQKFRPWSRPSETKTTVPKGAKIVLSEFARQKEKVWLLKITHESNPIWESEQQKSRAQADDNGKKVATALGIPFEVDSEFER